MGITIGNLEHISTEAILEVFNEAFSGYFIPFHLTLENLEAKIKSDNIKLAFSVGAFENDKLVGFILHGIKKEDSHTILYNGGTGVIASHRGQGLTVRMYDYLIPILKSQQVSSLILEVISINESAIKVYKKVGFLTTRKLACFKGELVQNETITDHKIAELETLNWSILKSFWDILPAWQNSELAITLAKDNLKSWGAYIEKQLVGYIVYNPKNNRLLQIAVDNAHRRKGIATALIAMVANNYGSKLSIINVQDDCKSIMQFLKKINLTDFLYQDEMTMNLAY